MMNLLAFISARCSELGWSYDPFSEGTYWHECVLMCTCCFLASFGSIHLSKEVSYYSLLHHEYNGTNCVAVELLVQQLQRFV